jgi:hypothetical protein
MRRLAAVVAVLFVSGSAAACGIDEVAGKIQFAAITRAADLATQQTFLLKKFGAIGERAKRPEQAAQSTALASGLSGIYSNANALPIHRVASAP